jgi:hypothetical protein
MQAVIWTALIVVGLIGIYAVVQYQVRPAIQEGMKNADREDSNIKKIIEFINYLIVHSDPTPDNSGDYTSDVGVDMITTFLKTLPTKQRLHPRLAPYLELLQFTTDTEENDAIITNLKKLIVDLAEKESAKLETKKLKALAKASVEDMEETELEETDPEDAQGE